MEAGQTIPPGDGQVSDELIFNLLQAAISRPEAERESFLQQACSGNGALLAEVERRLHWEAHLKGFLLTPVVTRERIDHPFVPGQLVLERFRIFRIAGEGGMGVVYEAVDERLGQRRALKCPRFEFRKRISGEALKSLSIAHPNVCRVFDVHTAQTPTGDVDFIAMEFLDGETLASRLDRPIPERWLETPEGKAIALQICEGLKAVHGQGITHRDLKPGNIMLSADSTGKPRAALMDFGIAQAAEIFSSQVRGTPAYVAPEVWKGQSADPQSDLYAVGVILYQMATGVLPFPEGTAWERRLQSTPQPPSAAAPERNAILRCLNPDPMKRAGALKELEEAFGQRRRLRWPSRRSLIGGGAGLVAAAFAGELYKQYRWPSSPVRLVVLPAAIEGLVSDSATDDRMIFDGFLHGISARLQTLRHVRRPLTIIAAERASQTATTSPARAKELYAATHLITSRFHTSSAGASWAVKVTLAAIGDESPIEEWNARVASPGLAEQLFYWEQSVIEKAAEKLTLRSDRQRQILPRGTYEDYLKGLYYVRFNYEQAAQGIPFFRRVIAVAPLSALGHIGLAEAYLGVRGDKAALSKALEEVSLAEALDPDLPQIDYIKGRINIRTNLFEIAVSQLRHAAQLDPHDCEIFISMTYALYQLGRIAEAEEALQQAVLAQPGYYKPYVDFGQFYSLQGQLGRAEEQWRKAVRLAPRQFGARLNLAELYTNQGLFQSAKEQIQECLQLARTQDVLAQLAALQERTNQPIQAIETYKQAIATPPRTYTLHVRLGLLYRSQNKKTEATASFSWGLEEAQSAMKSFPREADRFAWAAYYQALLGNASEARALAREAWAKADHSESNVRKLIVLCYDELHDREAVLGLLKDATPDLISELQRSPYVSVTLKRGY